MSTQTADTSVRLDIVVAAPVERAFRFFTEEFHQVKPPEHNMLPVAVAATVMEPRAGGRVYDRGVDGSECQWARVLVFEPPTKLVIAWDINPQWQIDSDPEKASEVEILFNAESAERTRVELEHRHLDRHGEGWEGERDGVAEGWPLYLNRFSALLAD